MSPPLPVHAVLFDLDGTLMDSERHTHEVIRTVLLRLGLPDVQLPDHLVYGRRWEDVAVNVVEALGEGAPRVEVLGPLLSDAYDLVVFREVVPIPGAVAAVREAARHLTVGLVTSSPASYARLALEALGLDAEIPPARRVTAGEVPRGKPAPDPFLLGAVRVGAAPEHTVVFEDSAAGLSAAEAAGMRRVAVVGSTQDHDRRRAQAHRVIRDYRDLPVGYWEGVARGEV